MAKTITYNADGQLIDEQDDGIPDPPNWNGFRQAVWNNTALLGKALYSCGTNPANAAAIALFSDAITSGEMGTGTQNGILTAWNLINVSWNQGEKDTINGYLEANSFTVRV